MRRVPSPAQVRFALVALALSLVTTGAVRPSSARAAPDAGAEPLELRADPPELPPANGPALRERGARRRGGSTASGALMIAILVGAMGYYVVKRLRR